MAIGLHELLRATTQMFIINNITLVILNTIHYG